MYDPTLPRPRATLAFWPPRGAVPLHVILDGVREARWPFAHAPWLRVPFRFAAVVRSVRFASVRSYASEPGAAGQTVHVEVDFEGGAPLTLEGEHVIIGPIERPVIAPPSTPPPSALLS